jgi:predicted nuclease of restriction endonuclease-like (RecB) superfamily
MYQIWKTVPAKLSWSHYLELIKIEEEPKRNFYLNKCINSKWSEKNLKDKGILYYMKLSN